MSLFWLIQQMVTSYYLAQYLKSKYNSKNNVVYLLWVSQKDQVFLNPVSTCLCEPVRHAHIIANSGFAFQGSDGAF